MSIGFGLLAFALALGALAFTLGGTTVACCGLRLDPLAALMAVLISGIGLVVRLYSRRYMAEEAGYRRFYVLLDAMIASLLVLVMADHLLVLLAAWHLVGVLLYWLLGQDMQSRSAHRYATWTFITYRVGDLPLVLAAVLLYRQYGTWSLSGMFEALHAGGPPAATAFGLPFLDTVAILVALSAFARSAQFLLHTWLPYTMSGPTPVSALMHAGIVNAGGFLLNRFAPVLVHTSEVLHWIFIVGLVTAVIGSVLMLAQNDIKKSLGYSTMGQMGFMIMEVGVGAFSLAVYHLIAHGFFKGTLFLGAGGVIGEARRHDGVPANDLYTFVVERRPAPRAQSWLVMAGLSLVLPIAVLVAAHGAFEADLFQQQGAIVLLFFGWLAGAQLVFSTHRMQSEQPWRLFMVVLVSFVLVVMGYVLVSHAFDLFLYPDPAFRARIADAAGIDLAWFDVLVGVLTAVIVAGWVHAYRAERDLLAGRVRATPPLWRDFYALVSREFYVADLYAGLARALLALSTRLNVWMRWL
ncbi:MAG: NADH-quinone oxidoreductase subunit L [Thiobacillus sp.]|nr:NADH-quinone oxidoreductase subunit L [Thiobacillus sp.]